MFYYNNKYKNLIRIIAAITLACFLSYDVVWAHPLDNRTSTHTLQPQTLITSGNTAESVSLVMLKEIVQMLSKDPASARLANIQKVAEERFSKIRKKYKDDLIPKEEIMPEMADEAEENQIFLRSGNEVLRIFVMGLGRKIPSPQEVLKVKVVEESDVVPVASIYGYQILKVDDSVQDREYTKKLDIYFNEIYQREYGDSVSDPHFDEAVRAGIMVPSNASRIRLLVESARYPENWLNEFTGDWEEDFIKEISGLSADELAEKFLSYFGQNHRKLKDLRNIKSITSGQAHLSDIYINLLTHYGAKEKYGRQTDEAIWLLREWIYRHWDNSQKERSYDLVMRTRTENRERVITSIMSMVYSPVTDPINMLNTALADLITRFSETHTLADSELPGIDRIFDEMSGCAKYIREISNEVIDSAAKGDFTNNDVNYWYVKLVKLRDEAIALRDDFKDVYQRYKKYFDELEYADDEEMGVNKGFEKALKDLDAAISILNNRIRYAQGSVDTEEINLFDLILRASEYHSGRIDEDLQEGIEISYAPEEAIYVNADEISLLNGISNIVNNALVLARTNKKGEYPKVAISVRREKDSAVIVIEDNGDQINPELLAESEAGRQKIFDFNEKTGKGKVEKNAQRNTEAWYVITDHKGEIKAYSSGKGNTFEISIPIIDREVLPGTAEGGLVPLHMTDEWIENRDIDKLVDHVTRGLQGSHDEMLDTHIRYILEKLGKGEDLRPFLRGLKKQERSDDPWKSKTAKSALTLIFYILLEDFAQDVLYSLVATEKSLESKKKTRMLSRPVRANDLNLARIIKTHGEIEADDFKYLYTAIDAKNRVLTISKELLEVDNVFNEFQSRSPISESSQSFIIDAMYSMLVEKEIVDIYYEDDQFISTTVDFAKKILQDPEATEEEKIKTLALMGAKIIEPLLLGIVDADKNIVVGVLENFIANEEYEWGSLKEGIESALKVLISYPGYKKDIPLNASLEFITKYSDDIDVLLNIVGAKIPFSEPDRRQIFKVLWRNPGEAEREVSSAWNLFIMRKKYVPLIAKSILAVINNPNLSEEVRNREIRKVVTKYITAVSLGHELWYRGLLNIIVKSVLNDETLDIETKAKKLLEMLGPVTLTILPSVDYDEEAKREIFEIIIQNKSDRKTELNLGMMRAVSVILRSKKSEMNSRAFSFLMDMIGKHGEMADVHLLLGTVKNTGYFHELRDNPNDEYFLKIGEAVQRIIRRYGDKAKQLGGDVDKILRTFDDSRFVDAKTWISKIVEEALNEIGFSWIVAEKKRFFSRKIESHIKIIPYKRGRVFDLGDRLFASGNMEEETARVIYDLALAEGNDVPAAFLHLYKIVQPFHDFFSKKNNVTNNTLLHSLFRGPHYLPRIYVLSQEAMDQVGAGGNSIVRYQDAIVISEEKWHDMISKTYLTGNSLMNPLLNVMVHEAMAWYAASRGINAGELGVLAEGKLDIEDWQRRLKLHKGMKRDDAFSGPISGDVMKAFGIIGPEEAFTVETDLEMLDSNVFSSLIKYFKKEKERVQLEVQDSRNVGVQEELNDLRDAAIKEGAKVAEIINTDLTKIDKKDIVRTVAIIIKNTEILKTFREKDDAIRQWIQFFNSAIEFIKEEDRERNLLDRRLADNIHVIRKQVLDSEVFRGVENEIKFLEQSKKKIAANEAELKPLQNKIAALEDVQDFLNKLFHDEKYKAGKRGVFIVGDKVKMPIPGLGYCIEANSGSIYIDVNEFERLVRLDAKRMSALAERILRLVTLRKFLLDTYFKSEIGKRLNRESLKLTRMDVDSEKEEWEKQKKITDTLFRERKGIVDLAKSAKGFFIKWLRAKLGNQQYVSSVIEVYSEALAREKKVAKTFADQEIYKKLEAETANVERLKTASKASMGPGAASIYESPMYEDAVLVQLIKLRQEEKPDMQKIIELQRELNLSQKKVLLPSAFKGLDKDGYHHLDADAVQKKVRKLAEEYMSSPKLAGLIFRNISSAAYETAYNTVSRADGGIVMAEVTEEKDDVLLRIKARDLGEGIEDVEAARAKSFQYSTRAKGRGLGFREIIQGFGAGRIIYETKGKRWEYSSEENKFIETSRSTVDKGTSVTLEIRKSDLIKGAPGHGLVEDSAPYLPAAFSLGEAGSGDVLTFLLISLTSIVLIYPTIKALIKIWIAKRVLNRYLRADNNYADKNGLTAKDRIGAFSNRWLGMRIDPSEGSDNTIQIDEGIRVFGYTRESKIRAVTHYKPWKVSGKYTPIKIVIFIKMFFSGLFKDIKYGLSRAYKWVKARLIKDDKNGDNGKTTLCVAPITLFAPILYPVFGSLSPVITATILALSLLAVIIGIMLKPERFKEKTYLDIEPKSSIEGEIRKYLGMPIYFKSNKFPDGAYRLEVTLNPKESNFEGNSYDIKVFFEDGVKGREILAGFLLDVKFTNFDQIMLGWGGSINYPELRKRFNSFKEEDFLASNLPLLDGMQRFSEHLRAQNNNYKEHVNQFLKNTPKKILENDVILENYLETTGRNFEGDTIAQAINEFISSVTPFDTETSFKIKHDFTLRYLRRGMRFEDTGLGRLYTANGYKVTDYRGEVVHLTKVDGINGRFGVNWLDEDSLGRYAEALDPEEASEDEDVDGSDSGGSSIFGTFGLIIIFIIALFFPRVIQAAEPADTEYTYYFPSGRIETMTFPTGWDNDTPGYIYDDFESGAMATLSNESFYDMGTPGDPTDDRGRMIKITYPDGSYETYQYYSGTDEIEYIRGYDSLDNPTFVQETVVRETTVDGFAIRTYTDGGGAYYILSGGNMYPNVQREAGGTIKVHEYDVSWNQLYTTIYYADGRAERLDHTQEITEAWAPGSDFKRGANLPWVRYGYDLGINRFGDPYEGLATKREQLLQDLNQWRGCTLRVFLFCDLRSGVTFDGSDTPTGFTSYVYDDMDTLIEAAQVNGVNLIPVLLDFTLADGVSFEGPTQIGETPNLITNATDRAALISLMGNFVDTYKDSSPISMWEIMNEPEEIQMNGQASWPELQTFVKEFIVELHNRGVEVTLGSQDREFLLTYWTDDMLGVSEADGLDVYQFHYYNIMETVAGKELNVSVSSMSVSKPVIIGELDPTQDANNGMTLMERFENIWSNGYEGAFPWQDDSSTYTLTASDADDIRSYKSTIDNKPFAPNLTSIAASNGDRTFTITWDPYTGALQGSAEGYTVIIGMEEFFVSGVATSSTVIDIPDYMYSGNYNIGIRTEMPDGQTDGNYSYWDSLIYIGKSPDEIAAEEETGLFTGCSVVPASTNSLNIEFFLPLAAFLIAVRILRNRQPKSGAILREQFATWIKEGKWQYVLAELGELAKSSNNFREKIFENYISKLTDDQLDELTGKLGDKQEEDIFGFFASIAELEIQARKQKKTEGLSLFSLADYLVMGFSGIGRRSKALYEELTGKKASRAYDYTVHEVVVDEPIKKAFSDNRVSVFKEDDERLLEVVSFLRDLNRNDLINILLKLVLEEKVKAIQPLDETFDGHASPRGIYIVEGDNDSAKLVHEFGAYLHNGHDFNRALESLFKAWQKDKNILMDLRAERPHFYEILGERLDNAKIDPLAMYSSPEINNSSDRFGVLFRDFQREWNDESTQDEAINPILVGASHKSVLSKVFGKIFKGSEEPIESDWFYLMDQVQQIDRQTKKLIARWDEKKNPKKGKIVSLVAVKENSQAHLTKSIVRILKDEKDRIERERDVSTQGAEKARDKKIRLEREIKRISDHLQHLEEASQRRLSEENIGSFVEGVVSQGKFAINEIQRIIKQKAIDQNRSLFVENAALISALQEQLKSISDQIVARENINVSDDNKNYVAQWLEYYNKMLGYIYKAAPEEFEEARELKDDEQEKRKMGMITIVKDEDLEAEEGAIKALEDQLDAKEADLRMATSEEENYSEEKSVVDKKYGVIERAIELLGKEYFSVAPGSRNVFICDTGKDTFSTGQTSYIDISTGNIFITKKEYKKLMKIGPFALTARLLRLVGERELLLKRIIHKYKVEQSTAEWLRHEAIGTHRDIKSLQSMNSDLIMALQSELEQNIEDVVTLKKEINRVKSKVMSRDELFRGYDWMTKWEERIEKGEEKTAEIERIKNEIVDLENEKKELSDEIASLTDKKNKLKEDRIDAGDKTPAELLRWLEERLQDDDEWYRAIQHGNGLGGTIKYIPNQQFARQFLSEHMRLLEWELDMVDNSPSAFSSEKEKLIESLRRELLALMSDEKRLTYDDPEHVKKFSRINLSSPFFVYGLDEYGHPRSVAEMKWDEGTVIYTDRMVRPTEEFKEWNTRHEFWHTILSVKYADTAIQEIAATALAFFGMTEIRDEHLRIFLRALKHEGRSPPEVFKDKESIKAFLEEIIRYYKDTSMPSEGLGVQIGIKDSLQNKTEEIVDKATDIVYEKARWAEKTYSVDRVFNYGRDKGTYKYFDPDLDSGTFLPTPLEELMWISEFFLTGEEKVLDLGGGNAYAAANFALSSGRVRSVEIAPNLHEEGVTFIEKDLSGVVDIDNVEHVKGDFFNQDFSGFDFIYIFWPNYGEEENEKVKERLQEKLISELKSGAVFVVNETADIGEFQDLHRIKLPASAPKHLSAYVKASPKSSVYLASILKRAIENEEDDLAYDTAFSLLKLNIKTAKPGIQKAETVFVIRRILAGLRNKSMKLLENRGEKDQKVKAIQDNLLRNADGLISYFEKREEEPTQEKRSNTGSILVGLASAVSVLGASSIMAFKGILLTKELFITLLGFAAVSSILYLKMNYSGVYKHNLNDLKKEMNQRVKAGDINFITSAQKALYMLGKLLTTDPIEAYPVIEDFQKSYGDACDSFMKARIEKDPENSQVLPNETFVCLYAVRDQIDALLYRGMEEYAVASEIKKVDKALEDYQSQILQQAEKGDLTFLVTAKNMIFVLKEIKAAGQDIQGKVVKLKANVDNAVNIFFANNKKITETIPEEISDRITKIYQGIRDLQDTEGGAIGKLFRDKEATDQIIEGIVGEERGDFLILKDREGNKLYTKDGREARFGIIETTPLAERPDIKLKIIEDNDSIKGFASKKTVYVAESLSENYFAIYHEEKENYYANNPDALPEGINAHTYIRGCGRKVRELAEKAIDENKLSSHCSANQMVFYLRRNLPEERWNENEFNLIRSNEREYLARGMDLLYGEQDRDPDVGIEANELFTKMLRGEKHRQKIVPVMHAREREEGVALYRGKPVNWAFVGVSLGILSWIVSSANDAVRFYRMDFLKALLPLGDIHTLIFRTICLVSFIVFGLAVERSFRRQRASQDMYKNLFEDSPVPFHEIDNKGVIKRVNKQWLITMGYDNEDEVRGENIFDFVVPDQKEAAYRRFHARVNDKAVPKREGDRKYMKKDGTLIIVSTKDTVIRDDKNNITGVLTSFIDITDLRKAEEERKQSEEKFLKAFNLNPALMAISTVEGGRFIEVNESFLNALGYTREEVEGKTSRELDIFADPEAREGIVEKLKADGAVQGVEVEVKTKDGRKRYGLFSIEKIQLEGEEYLLTIMNDITDRKKAEKKLSEEQRKYVELYHNAPFGYHHIDSSGKLISVNNTEAKMLGYELSEMIGKPVWMFLAEENQEQAKLAIEEKFNKKREFKPFERRYQKKDGSLIWVRIEERPTFDDNGNIIGIRSSLQDITEQKEAEDRIRAILENLPDAVFYKEFDGEVMRIKYANQEFYRMLGLDPDKDDVEGLTDHELKEKFGLDQYYDADKYAEDDLEVYKEKISIDAEEVNERNGKRIFVHIRKTCFWNGVLGAFTDVTRRKETEEALRTTLRELEDANRRLEDANRKLERISMTDPKTGARNIRFLAKEFPGRLDPIKRHIENHIKKNPDIPVDASVSLIFADIDDFGQFNKKFGEAIGDRVLRGVVEAVEPRLKRRGDLLIRYGGEEFLIVLFNADAEAAAKRAADILETVRELKIDLVEPFKDKKTGQILGSVDVTWTMGVSEVTLDEMRKFINETNRIKELYKRQLNSAKKIENEKEREGFIDALETMIEIEETDACNIFVDNPDKAMRIAKKLGKNRIVVLKPDGSHEAIMDPEETALREESEIVPSDPKDEEILEEPVLQTATTTIDEPKDDTITEIIENVVLRMMHNLTTITSRLGEEKFVLFIDRDLASGKLQQSLDDLVDAIEARKGRGDFLAQWLETVEVVYESASDEKARAVERLESLNSRGGVPKKNIAIISSNDNLDKFTEFKGESTITGIRTGANMTEEAYYPLMEIILLTLMRTQIQNYKNEDFIDIYRLIKNVRELEPDEIVELFYEQEDGYTTNNLSPTIIIDLNPSEPIIASQEDYDKIVQVIVSA